MKTITSRQNPLFKRVRDALREHRDEIVLEGPKAVADALAAGWAPLEIFSRGDAARAAFPSAASRTAVAFADELFDALADTKTPQNVLALFRRPTFGLSRIFELATESVVVALDGVQDPGNVGTIVRLAAAFDVAGVVLLPGTADAYSPKSIRASAGTMLSVPVVNATARDLIASELPMYAADVRGKSSGLPPRRAIIVLGNEGRGVSDEIRAVAKPIAIRMSTRVESLNVAAAAAILLSRSFDGR